MAFNITSIIVVILECIPITDFWVHEGGKNGGRCINVIKFLLVNGSINTVTDFVLLLLVSNVSPIGFRHSLTLA